MSRCTHTHCLLLPCTGRPPFAQAKARREVPELPAGWKCLYNGQSYKWYNAAVKEMCPCNKADKLRDAVKAAVQGGRPAPRPHRRSAAPEQVVERVPEANKKRQRTTRVLMEVMVSGLLLLFVAGAL